MLSNWKPASISSPWSGARGRRRRSAALLGAALLLPIAALISCASTPGGRPAAARPNLAAQFGALSHPGALLRVGNISLPLPLGWSAVRSTSSGRFVVLNQASQVRAVFSWVASRPGIDVESMASYLLRYHAAGQKPARRSEVKPYLLDGYPASLAVPASGHTALLAVQFSGGVLAGEFTGTGRALIPALSARTRSASARVREHFAFFGLTPTYPWRWYSDLGDGFVLVSRYRGEPIFLAIYDPRTHTGGIAAAPAGKPLSAPVRFFLDALPVTSTPSVAVGQDGGRVVRMQFSYEGRSIECQIYLPRAGASFDYGSLLASPDLRDLFRLHVTVGSSVRWNPDPNAVNLVPRRGA